MTDRVIPRKVYYWVFTVLVLLTLLTVGAAQIDLGRFHLLVALTIAFGKAILVAFYFMHLRYDNRLIWVFLTGGVFWLAILIGITMSDYLARTNLTSTFN